MHVLEEFNILNKIIALTTDNDSAMLAYEREIAGALDNEFSSMNFSHYRCVAHVLNLGVKKGLKAVGSSIIKARKIICIIKNLTQLCDSLHAFCNLKKIKYLKPILDVKTHWNSTYYMLKCFNKLELALFLFATDNHSISAHYPNDNDWILIKVNYKKISIF